jgi:chromosome segregation ATPase
MHHVTKLNARINEVTSGRRSEEQKTKVLKVELARDQARIASLESDLQTLREKWTTIDAEEFTDTTESVCAACGQSLPADRVEEARTRALAQFNQSKAERLMKVETKGKELRAELDMITQSVEELHGRLIARETQADDDQLTMLTTERDILKARAEDYTNIPGRAEMLEQKAALEGRIEESRAGLSQGKEAIQKEIDGLHETRAGREAHRGTEGRGKEVVQGV